MSSQAYVGLSNRTFEQALIHLLENDYGLLGSRRVLDLLVKDVQQLVHKFFPAKRIDDQRTANGSWSTLTNAGCLCIRG